MTRTTTILRCLAIVVVLYPSPSLAHSADLLDDYGALTLDNPAAFYLPHQRPIDLFDHKAESYAFHRDVFDHHAIPNDYLRDDLFSRRKHYVPDDPLYTYPKGSAQ